MANWPDVTIVVCTYDRPKEIRDTIESLQAHIIYPEEHLHLHIADDGSPSPTYIDEVRHFAAKHGFEYPIGSTITNRKGWGANVNKALRAITTDYVYFTEDDYVLNKTLRLDSYVALMECAPTIGLVRFGIAGHSLTCHLNEVDISNWIPDYVEGTSTIGSGGKGKINAWVIDKRFSTGPYSFYRYSNRPHLKHRRFHETYGYYPEGLSLALTEHKMNNQFYDGPDAPFIVCPADWTLWHYEHIGVSRQHTKDDIHEAV